MFNLLISGGSEKWEKCPASFSRDRVIRKSEYTVAEIAKKYSHLNDANISKLMEFPCIFAYEGIDGFFRIGYIKHVRLRSQEIIIDFEFDQILPALPMQKLFEHKLAFDISHDFEFSRHHWAVKDVDLFSELVKQGIVTQEQLQASVQARIAKKTIKTEGHFVSFFKRRWTDGERWGMGILSALLIAGIIAVASIVLSKGSSVGNPTDGIKPKASDQKYEVENSSEEPNDQQKFNDSQQRKLSTNLPIRIQLTNSEIKAIVYSSIASVLKIDEMDINPDMTVMQGEGIDSLHYIEMVIAIESKSKCPISDNVAVTVRTVRDLVEITVDSCQSKNNLKEG